MYNGHADITALIDTNGNIVASYYYDAFGNILEETGTQDNPYRYAGYMYDEETGLYYLNARYYDAKIARFLSEDTYRGSAVDPLSLNLYAYCHNEPIMYIDPDGHRAIVATDSSGIDITYNSYTGNYSYNGVITNDYSKIEEEVKKEEEKAKEQTKKLEEAAAEKKTEEAKKKASNVVTPKSNQGTGNSDWMSNFNLAEMDFDTRYLLDKDFRQYMDAGWENDFGTDWRLEGQIYGFKKAGVDTANLFIMMYNDAVPKYDFDPDYWTIDYIEVSHKEAFFENNKRTFETGALEGQIMFEGVSFYASMAGGELISVLSKSGKVVQYADDVDNFIYYVDDVSETVNTVDDAARIDLSKARFRDAKTGRFVQNPTKGALERYGPIKTSTVDITGEAITTAERVRMLEEFKTADEAGGLLDALSIAAKEALKKMK